MSVTYTRAADLVREQKEICNLIETLKGRIDRFLSQNSTVSIDWGNATPPANLTIDADGNLDGFTFSRQDVANAVYSLLQIQNVLTNQVVSQGDHLGNINKIADLTL